MNNHYHAFYLVVLLGALGFFIVTRQDHNIPSEYNTAFYLNIVLFVASLALENWFPDEGEWVVGKVLFEWVLYYEIVAPIVFLFYLAIERNVLLSYTTGFFFGYLLFPFAYFAILTTQSVSRFMQDTP